MTTKLKVKAAITVVLVFCTFWVWIANREKPAPTTPDPRPEPETEVVEPTPTPAPEVAKEPEPSVGPTPEEKSVELTGLVLDAVGDRPVEGARVELIKGGSLDGYAEMVADPHLAETVTDIEGKFRFDATLFPYD